jgi:hypothetical protein
MNLRTALLTVLSIGILIFPGCGQAGNTQGTTDAGVWSIDVEVVGQAPVKFTNEDAAKLGPADIKAAQKDGDAFLEERTYTGIPINDFLGYMGIDKYSVISVEATDGYTKEFAPGDISETGMGLCWAANGEKLGAESGPVMLVNNGRGPKHWVKMVAKITIIK